MTSHQLARELLARPDLPVGISVNDWGGMVSPAERIDVVECRPCPDDDDYLEMRDGPESGSSPVLVVHPERHG